MPRSAAAAALALLLVPAALHAQPAAPAAPATPAPAAAKPARAPDLKARVDALEARLDDLAPAAAASATAAATVQELSTRVGALEQAIAARGAAEADRAELIARADELERRVIAAEAEVNALATRLGDVEQPVVAGGGSHDGGFVIGDGGRYRLTIGGYVQPRLEATTPEALDDVETASFRLRRARLSFAGQAGERVGFKVMLEARDPASALLDAYADVKLGLGITARIGQTKVPFTRAWITSSRELMFLERPTGLDNLRYDRDLGAWLRGKALDDRLRWTLGASNGAGKNTVNDNIDFVLSGRVEAALRGEWMEGYGDLERSPEPRIQVGLGATHDLIRLPDLIAGIELGDRDVDDDGAIDNVRVISASADAGLRWCGFELALEGWLRQERWGTILDHSGNGALADAVDANGEGRVWRGGAMAELTYVPAPGWLLIGARYAHSKLGVLGVGGNAPKAPPAAALLQEVELTAQILEDGGRTLGVGYTFFDLDGRGSQPDPAADKSHRFIVEYQWRL